MKLRDRLGLVARKAKTAFVADFERSYRGTRILLARHHFLLVFIEIVKLNECSRGLFFEALLIVDQVGAHFNLRGCIVDLGVGF